MGEIVVDTSMKELLRKLDVQGFVLDLEDPLKEVPTIKDYSLRFRRSFDFNSSCK